MNMLKSLKDYITSLGYWGLSVIAPIVLDIIGVYQLFNDNQLDIIPFWAWFLAASVLFLAIPFIAFHKLRLKSEGIKVELDRLKKERPEVITKIARQSKNYCIEVLNKGEEAEFEAQVELISGTTFVPSLPLNYLALWKNTISNKTRIKQGQKDWLKIAELEIDTGITLMSYILYFCESSNSNISTINSTAWVPGSNEDVKPQIRFKITISSQPSMIQGAITNYYELSDKGLSEIHPTKILFHK